MQYRLFTRHIIYCNPLTYTPLLQLYCRSVGCGIWICFDPSPHTHILWLPLTSPILQFNITPHLLIDYPSPTTLSCNSTPLHRSVVCGIWICFALSTRVRSSCRGNEAHWTTTTSLVFDWAARSGLTGRRGHIWLGMWMSAVRFDWMCGWARLTTVGQGRCPFVWQLLIMISTTIE